MEYLCVSITEDERGTVVLLKHPDIPKVFCTIVTDNPSNFVMGKMYRITITESNKEE